MVGLASKFLRETLRATALYLGTGLLAALLGVVVGGVLAALDLYPTILLG